MGKTFQLSKYEGNYFKEKLEDKLLSILEKDLWYLFFHLVQCGYINPKKTYS